MAVSGHIVNGHAVNGGATDGDTQWIVPASEESKNCHNPIRIIEESRFKDVLAQRRQDIEFIKLSIGDTSAIATHSAVNEAIRTALDSGTSFGYGHSSGLECARKAVASHFSPFTTDKNGLTYENVIMTCACSGALDLSISVLCNSGQNILSPSPGFGLYTCLSGAKGLESRLYRLVPEQSWEVDLVDLESKIDDNTAAIIVNNPSNPCGCSYSREHLLDILAVAERHRLPIITDEIYAGMVFPGQEFHHLASLSHNVPILACGGLAKKFMVPGWRLGWVIIHDRNGAFREVAQGLSRLAMKLLGPSTLIQAALPDIFSNVPLEYHQKNLELFHTNATLCCKLLGDAPGLTPIMPKGTMYIMVVIDLKHFPEFDTDVAFMRQLVLEQSVFCLPGVAFNSSSCFRIVLASGVKRIEEACRRIVAFSSAHYHQ